MPSFISYLLFFVIALTFTLFPLRVHAALPKELPPAPAKFLTDSVLTRGEELWITAETGGVYRLDGKSKDVKWEDMRKSAGFPKAENCTAVSEDSRGRIWVGTSNNGVLVYAGGKWARYDRDTVLSGSHVFDIASSASGLTAVAHEQGVSLYDSRVAMWRDFTVLNGLPPGPVQAVSFLPNGNLGCAMETGGFVLIDPKDGGRVIRRVSGPDTWGKSRAVLYPLTTAGSGLCSIFCNSLSVSEKGQICIGSFNGISYGAGKDFRFIQGKDLKAKLEGAARRDLIESALQTFKEQTFALKESYVSCVRYVTAQRATSSQRIEPELPKKS